MVDTVVPKDYHYRYGMVIKDAGPIEANAIKFGGVQLKLWQIYLSVDPGTLQRKYQSWKEAGIAARLKHSSLTRLVEMVRGIEGNLMELQDRGIGAIDDSYFNLYVEGKRSQAFFQKLNSSGFCSGLYQGIEIEKLLVIGRGEDEVLAFRRMYLLGPGKELGRILNEKGCTLGPAELYFLSTVMVKRGSLLEELGVSIPPRRRLEISSVSAELERHPGVGGGSWLRNETVEKVADVLGVLAYSPEDILNLHKDSPMAFALLSRLVGLQKGVAPVLLNGYGRFKSGSK